jgi:hypothetical protein
LAVAGCLSGDGGPGGGEGGAALLVDTGAGGALRILSRAFVRRVALLADADAVAAGDTAAVAAETRRAFGAMAKWLGLALTGDADALRPGGGEGAAVGVAVAETGGDAGVAAGAETVIADAGFAVARDREAASAVDTVLVASAGAAGTAAGGGRMCAGDPGLC